MRSLLGFFVLLMSIPSAGHADEFEAARLERIERYRAVIADIAAQNSLSAALPHDLPAAVREVIEAATGGTNSTAP